MMTANNNWFELEQPKETDTPALLVFPDRVRHNIETAINMVAGNTDRLQPHVKTCKAVEPVMMMMKAGIKKFKCATIAEAEMLAQCAVHEVLLAYLPIGPKLERLIGLITTYPKTEFSFLTESVSAAKQQAEMFTVEGLVGNVYVDLNVGMNRTGIAPGEEALQVYEYCNEAANLHVKGLHVYDGHFRQLDYEEKEKAVHAAFATVEVMIEKIKEKNLPEPIVICGGSPSFSVHAKNERIVCSPGTFIYWDKGYQDICPEQEFLPAIVIATRVISKPANGLLTVDAGHKAMASENELDKRISFLNTSMLKSVSQSEEHLVLQNMGTAAYNIGDMLYALPFHVCPTVNLYNKVITIEDGKVTGSWNNVARNRDLT